MSASAPERPDVALEPGPDPARAVFTAAGNWLSGITAHEFLRIRWVLYPLLAVAVPALTNLSLLLALPVSACCGFLLGAGLVRRETGIGGASPWIRAATMVFAVLVAFAGVVLLLEHGSWRYVRRHPDLAYCVGSIGATAVGIVVGAVVRGRSRARTGATLGEDAIAAGAALLCAVLARSGHPWALGPAALAWTVAASRPGGPALRRAVVFVVCAAALTVCAAAAMRRPVSILLATALCLGTGFLAGKLGRALGRWDPAALDREGGFAAFVAARQRSVWATAFLAVPTGAILAVVAAYWFLDTMRDAMPLPVVVGASLFLAALGPWTAAHLAAGAPDLTGRAAPLAAVAVTCGAALWAVRSLSGLPEDTESILHGIALFAPVWMSLALLVVHLHGRCALGRDLRPLDGCLLAAFLLGPLLLDSLDVTSLLLAVVWAGVALYGCERLLWSTASQRWIRQVLPVLGIASGGVLWAVSEEVTHAGASVVFLLCIAGTPSAAVCLCRASRGLHAIPADHPVFTEVDRRPTRDGSGGTPIRTRT